MLVLYAQGFLLLGALVAVYNYLTFHLEVAPFNLSPLHISFLLFSYLAGTAAASCAGGVAAKYGRIKALCGFITVMIAGGLLLLSSSLPTVVAGLVLFTAGFFGAHAIASGWVGYRATAGASQAASLYNLFYYAGSSFFGWLCGLVFVSAGWKVMTAMVIGMAALSAALAAVHWRGHRQEA
jgi:predicted MFS family arabinose efflux permease